MTHPDKDLEDERAFPSKLEAPISLTLSYGFSAEKHTLRSGGGKSVDVMRLRVKSAWTGKRTAQSEKPFNSGYRAPTPPGINKNLICLHFTAGGFRGSLGSLTQDGRLVGVPFLIGRSGTIYELHEDEDWGNNSHRGQKAHQETVAIELVNVGPLIRTDDGFHVTKEGGAPGDRYCGLDETDLVFHLDEPFRGYRDFASHTKEQYDALVQLLVYLTDKYAIPYEFLEAKDPRSPSAKRYEVGAVADKWRGIASHVNFKKEGKWDIGPAFEWERLTARALSLPVGITSVGGAKPPPSAKEGAPPDATVGDELRITRASLDRLYAHTETDTANHGGSFPVGVNTLWHGGVHLFVDGVDVHACLDGQVVAARLRTPSVEGSRPDHYGSGAFLLLRHSLDLGLIGQLDRLRVPKTYTVAKLGNQPLGLDFTPAPAAAEPRFRFEPGDVFERADEEDTRLPTSDAGVAYPVRIQALYDAVEHVQGFDVLGVVDKAGSHKPTLVQIPGQPAFPLERGDRLKVLAPADLRRRDLKKIEYEVELVGLGDQLGAAKSYTVTTPWHLTFRKSQGTEPPTDTAPSKDGDRHPDLCKDDVLEIAHPDPAIEGEPSGEIEVVVKELAKDVKDPGTVKLTKSLLRPLLASTAADAAELLKLVADDKLTLVQRDARVSPKSRYDLVKLSALAPAPQVPNVGESGTVKAKSLTLFADRDGKKSVRALKKTETVVVAAAQRFPWLEVTAGADSGWILYDASSLDLPLVARDAAGWTKELLGKEAFVRAFSDAELKGAEPAASRALAVGTKGWVKVPVAALRAGGDARSVKHADKIGLRGKVAYDLALLEPKGRTRRQMYSALEGTAGQLTFDPALLAQSRVVRAPLAANAGKTFYSLYMHLDDKSPPLTKEGVKDVRWIPREVSSLKLKQPAMWRSGDGEPVALVAGDKLRPERPWLTSEGPGAPQGLFWDEIQEGDVVTSIAVKAGKEIGWLFGADLKTALMPLMPGDTLVPKVPAASYKKGNWVEVRVAKGHAWQTRRAASASGKRVVLMNEAGDQSIGSFARDQDVVELGASGTRSFVAAGGRARGWVATKDLGPPLGPAAGAPLEGVIRWTDAVFDPKVEKRTAAYGKHKGKLGSIVSPDLSTIVQAAYSEREEAPSTAILARLEAAEVVRFPLAAPGEKPTTCVRAGDPLWKSGTFAPVLPRDKPEGAYGKLIHWEIISEENLLPSRPFRPEDQGLWDKIAWPWWEVADTNDDWTMDCKEILAMVAKGIPESAAEQEREKIVGEILNPKELESLYTQPDVAAKLRHAACRFMLEWAVDPGHGLRRLKTAELDNAWWVNLKQRFASGPMQDWSRHVDGEWADRQARYFAPLLWWKPATRPGPPPADGLPGQAIVWHYNPIAFLEAFSAVDLAKESASKKP